MDIATRVPATAPARPNMLMTASIGYLLSISLGTALAVQQRLPADFIGFGLQSRGVLRDFVTANGTALSPPLWMALVQLLLTFLAVRPGRLGTIGVVGLALMGGAATLGQLGEPIVLRMLDPTTFSVVPALVLLANLTLSIGMLVIGVREWRVRHQQRRGDT